MKKCWILLLIFFPVVSFAVPSVRMLGGSSALTNVAKSQITPVKTEKKSATTSYPEVRIGTLKAKTKALQTTQNAKDSRFPVVVPAYSYNTVASPEQGQNVGYVSGGSTTNVDVGAIVEAVMQNVSGTYYDKNDVYNKNEIDNKLGDPRFDAIRIVRGRNGTVPSDADYPKALPSDYIYMWIEED